MRIKIYFIVSCLFLLGSCNKGDDNKSIEDFRQYIIYFDLKKPNGSSFSNNEVELSGLLYRSEYGDFSPSGDDIFWGPLGVVDHIEFPNDLQLFGPDCILSSCTFDYIGFGFALSGVAPSDNEPFDREQYYFLRFPNQETDTLRIHNQLFEDGTRQFDFYLNGIQKEVLGSSQEYRETDGNYLLIQK